jgi:AcrR family transcriptional regulator
MPMAGATRLTRSERAAQTRHGLLRAAERRFFRDGYHGTTLDEVADDAGFTKGAVYSTFKSKGGLFLALLDDVIERRLKEIRALVDAHGNSPEMLAALARQPVEERNTQFLLLSIEFLVHAAREPELLDGFAQRHRRLRESLAQIGPEGSQLGGPERWAMVTLALSNGFALERLIDPDSVPEDLMATVQGRLLQPDGA